jgi:hypothetical protein
MTGIIKCGVYTQWSIIKPKKEQIYVIYKKMNGIGDHYAKWDKADAQRLALHVFSHMWNVREVTDLEAELLGMWRV